MKKILLATLTLGFIISSQAWCMGPQRTYPELNTVARVNLSAYLGKWYEIVRLPLWFEKDCVGVTAEYSLKEDGRVDVRNTCKKASYQTRCRKCFNLHLLKINEWR